MAKYIVIDSKYNPLSFEEMIKPYQDYVTNYKTTQQAIADLETKASAIETLANTDDEWRGIYNDYISSIQDIGNRMSVSGYDSSILQDSLKAASTYNKVLTPILTADGQARALNKQLLDNEQKDPSVITSLEGKNITARDLYDNPYLDQYQQISGDQVYQQTYNMVKGIQEQGNIPNVNTKTIPGYAVIKNTAGYSQEDVFKQMNLINQVMINKMKPSDALNLGMDVGLFQLVQSQLANTGVQNWNNESATRKTLNRIYEGLFGAVGKTLYNVEALSSESNNNNNNKNSDYYTNYPSFLYIGKDVQGTGGLEIPDSIKNNPEKVNEWIMKNNPEVANLTKLYDYYMDPKNKNAEDLSKVLQKINTISNIDISESAFHKDLLKLGYSSDFTIDNFLNKYGIDGSIKYGSQSLKEELIDIGYSDPSIFNNTNFTKSLVKYITKGVTDKNDPLYQYQEGNKYLQDFKEKTGVDLVGGKGLTENQIQNIIDYGIKDAYEMDYNAHAISYKLYPVTRGEDSSEEVIRNINIQNDDAPGIYETADGFAKGKSMTLGEFKDLLKNKDGDYDIPINVYFNPLTWHYNQYEGNNMTTAEAVIEVKGKKYIIPVSYLGSDYVAAYKSLDEAYDKGGRNSENRNSFYIPTAFDFAKIIPTTSSLRILGNQENERQR